MTGRRGDLVAAAAVGRGVERRLDARRQLRPGRHDIVVVDDGVVEVFLVSTAAPPTAPRHVVSLNPGDALPGTTWAGDLAPDEHVALVGNGPATVRLLTLDEAGADSALGAAIAARHDDLADRLARLREPDDSLAVLRRRLDADEVRTADADDALAALLSRPDPMAGTAGADSVADASPQLRALLVAARAAGMNLSARAVEAARASADLGVAQLAGRLRIPIRAVDLGGAWWREDGIPLVAVDDDGRPVALVPRRGRRRGWRSWSPVEGWRDVPARGDGRSWAQAWCVYPALPARPVSLGDLLRIGAPPGAGRDLARIAASAVVVMLLGAGVPLAASTILGDAVPHAQAGNILAIAVLVAGLVVAFTAASITQGLLLQRLVQQINVRTTAALWSRVLRLEPPFFRQYNAGELARRVLAIDGIRDLLTGSVIAAGIGLLIGVTGILVTLFLDLTVGLTAIGGLVLFCGYAGLNLRRMVAARRSEVTERNAISGFVTALLTGIVKVRVAGAEGRVYARWATMFARQEKATTGANAAQRQLAVVTGALPTLGALVVIAEMTYLGETDVSVGAFVGLVTALTQVSTALSLVVPALAELTAAVPLYDAAKPVLRAAPRASTESVDPGPLRGAVEVSKVSFAYAEDAPPTLSDVDLVAAPGEFVAVVGPSGAGKSTLIRLLLGFDRPTSGAVLYDGKPLDTLDLEAVRRQIGVVTQNAQVPTGSILTAIVGTSQLSQEQAWEALEMAGLADDVRRMPMGIRTVISDGGSTFSGGQRQRLMIAKALVRRPKVLVFDEATSALDNVTQATVTRSLQGLDATRIVIAHRLSTIAEAQRIYVMERGRVVEQGSYADLIKQGGAFAKLARRQIA